VQVDEYLIPSNWALKHWFVRNRPVRFYNTEDLRQYRPFLVGYLNDLHPYKVALKARQLGLTEVSIIEIGWLVSVPDVSLKIVYCFPRGRQSSEFSKTRFDPAIQSSPLLSSMIRESSAGMKRFDTPAGNRVFVEIKSTWEEEFGEATDADIIYFDEYDRMRKDVLPAFEESLKASHFGWKRFISTPTLPGVGISNEYAMSDRRKWFIKCEHCGEWQYLTYKDNVIQTKGSEDLMRLILSGEITELEEDTFIIGCRKCKRKLTRLEDGEWVAENPSVKDVRGYHFTQLMAPWISANQIVLSVQRYKLRSIWYNYVLGEPFKEEGTTLTIHSSGELPKPGKPPDVQSVAVGIDWGKVNWAVVIGKTIRGHIQVLSVLYSPDTSEPLGGVKALTEKLLPYNPDIIVADSGWGIDRIEYLRSVFGKKVWGCFYARRRIKTFSPEWNNNTGVVQIAKVALIKYLKQLLDQKLLLNLSELNEQGRLLKRHVENVFILEQEDETGIMEEVVKSGDDHLLHCLAYAVLGLTRQTPLQSARTSVLTISL
jgi:hypothetical protein